MLSVACVLRWHDAVLLLENDCLLLFFFVFFVVEVLREKLRLPMCPVLSYRLAATLLVPHEVLFYQRPRLHSWYLNHTMHAYVHHLILSNDFWHDVCWLVLNCCCYCCCCCCYYCCYWILYFHCDVMLPFLFVYYFHHLHHHQCCFCRRILFFWVLVVEMVVVTLRRLLLIHLFFRRFLQFFLPHHLNIHTSISVVPMVFCLDFCPAKFATKH